MDLVAHWSQRNRTQDRQLFLLRFHCGCSAQGERERERERERLTRERERERERESLSPGLMRTVAGLAAVSILGPLGRPQTRFSRGWFGCLVGAMPPLRSWGSSTPQAKPKPKARSATPCGPAGTPVRGDGPRCPDTGGGGPRHEPLRPPEDVQSGPRGSDTQPSGLPTADPGSASGEPEGPWLRGCSVFPSIKCDAAD